MEVALASMVGEAGCLGEMGETSSTDHGMYRGTARDVPIVVSRTKMDTDDNGERRCSAEEDFITQIRCYCLFYRTSRFTTSGSDGDRESRLIYVP